MKPNKSKDDMINGAQNEVSEKQQIDTGEEL